MTSVLRDPDRTNTAFMTKRAWWLVGLNLLVPGAAQVLAGNRRLGRFGLGSTLVLWALVVVGAALAVFARGLILDIATNTKNFQFIEAAPEQLVRSLQDVDLAIINGNYALQAGLNPATDSLLLESGVDNPYANFLAVRAEDKTKPAIVKLDALLHSPEVKAFIEKQWPDGGVLPAF